MKKNTKHIETLLSHAGLCTDDKTGAISTPIYLSATFRHVGPGQSTGYDYSRTSNPTRHVLETEMAKLEGGNFGFAFASGMAAVAAVFGLFKPGSTILASNDLYGGTYRYLEQCARPNGVSTMYVDTSDMHQVRRLLDTSNVSAIFIESPTNPIMKITDIKELSNLAKSKKAMLIVDNTFMSPLLQRPLLLGADIVLHSGTKFLAGHNDTLCGIVVTKSKAMSDRIGFIQNATGGILSPFDSWLVLRGLKTLSVRLMQSQSNAQKIALWLTQQSPVKAVYYPGLPSHPGFSLHKKQALGAGSIISFKVTNDKKATSLLRRVKTISFAESLGGVETLITHPSRQTHTDIPIATRQCLGVTDDLLRLSIGIEHVDDLIYDLKNALE